MSLTRAQVEQLLAPVKASRVIQDDKGHSALSQQDVRAHLTRIFGFGGWSTEILDMRCIRDTTITVPAKNNRPARDGVPAVTYLCRLRLTVRDPAGAFLASFEDVGTGTSPNLPDYGDAHDFAAKVAVSYALKRCATNLGDGFGLSLYNKGQTKPLVVATLVMPDGEATAGDVQRDVPEQVDMGDEAPAERGDASPDDMQSAKARVWAAATALGFDRGRMQDDYESDHGNPIGMATVEELTLYAADLEARVKAAAA